MSALIRFSLGLVLFTAMCSSPTEPSQLLGDVNLDGSITQSDAALLMLYIHGQSSLTEQSLINSDVSRDGRINQEDAFIITNLCLEPSHD